jgi:hypothetical protein
MQTLFVTALALGGLYVAWVLFDKWLTYERPLES